MSSRLLVPLVAAACAAVLLGGVVTVIGSGTEPDPDVLRAAEPAPAAAARPTPTSSSAGPVASSTPAASPTPSATAVVVADAPATAPEPAAAPAAAPAPAPAKAPAPRREASQSAPDDGSGYGTSPGVVKHPYDPGRRTYSASSDGVALTAAFTTMTPKAGDAVGITLSGSADSPTCCTLHVLYGDGAGDDQQLSGHPCESDSRAARAEQQHAWNKPGRYTLQLQASTSVCHGEGRHVVMRVVVDVREGAPPVSNGPAQPKVSFDIYEQPRPEDPGLVKFSGSAEDRDGHVTHFVLDPGDGSAPRRIDAYKQGPCQQTPGGTSAASTGFLPHDPPPSHRYAQAGSYTARLTAYSVGCDGKHVQTGSATYTHAW